MAAAERPAAPGAGAAPAKSAARAAVSPLTQGRGGCSDFGFWGYRRPTEVVSAALALLAAAAAGALAAASCVPSLPRATPGFRTLAPDLLGGASCSCPRPGWVSWLGLGPPGVNVHLGVCGDRIRGKLGGGSLGGEGECRLRRQRTPLDAECLGQKGAFGPQSVQ